METLSRWPRLFVGLVAALALQAPVALAAEPDDSPSPLAVVTGVLPDVHAGPVRVLVLKMPDLSGARVGQRVTPPVIAMGTFNEGSAFRLPIAEGEVRADGRSAGWLDNVQVMAVSKAGATTIFAPVTRQPGAGGAIRLGRLPSFSNSLLTAAAQQMTRGRGMHAWHLRCTAAVVGRKTAATRVGQLHAAGKKVLGLFAYAGKADTTITVARLGGDTWFTDGSARISNSAPGGVVHTSKATDRYIETGFVFDKLHFTGDCNYYVQLAVEWDGSAPILAGKAPLSPYRSCHADPHGFITVRPGSSYLAMGYKAVDYPDDAGVAFGGYKFGAQSGYSVHVHPGWRNAGSTSTYLCGSAASSKHPNNWPIIYNLNH